MAYGCGRLSVLLLTVGLPARATAVEGGAGKRMEQRASGYFTKKYVVQITL